MSLDHLQLVDLFYMQNFSFLGHQEVFKKDGLGVGGFIRKWHFVAPSCKPVLARFSALLRIQDGAECGKTESLGTFSLKTKTRPRLSSFTGLNSVQLNLVSTRNI